DAPFSNLANFFDVRCIQEYPHTPRMPRSLIAWTHRRLLAHYGQPEWADRGQPLDELVATILSQHTSDLNSERAFASLKARYHTWEQARDAPTPELVEVIRSGGLAVIKAERIQAVLRAVTGPDGRIGLPNLTKLGRRRSVKFLTGLPGVGRKTAACVLLFGAH